MIRPVLILGTGPTLKTFDVGPFVGRAFIIAVNDAYRLCPRADMFYACDFDWWVFHGMNLRDLPGEKVTLRHDDSTPINVLAREVKAIKVERRGFSLNPNEIYMGHNSGFQALQLAAHRTNRVFMAGFDMGATGKTHFFGDHPAPIAVGSDYPMFVEDFRSQQAAIRAAARVSLVTSPSALDSVFETISPEDAIRELP